ncbi:c-type cytochrome [Achromobacter aloeverae]
MKKVFLRAMLALAGLTAAAAHAEQTDQGQLIARGEYIARLGDCMACHTADKKHPYAGGLAIQSPFGVIYSTNITPDPQAGIGGYTEEEFASALRNGVRKDGSRLYPAMPYPSYAKMTDQDVHALYAYFMHGVAADAKAAPETDLSFPFNQRWGLRFWNFFFTDDAVFQPDPKADDRLVRGAYLVEGLGHCGSCHTPRSFTMQEKAYDGSSEHYLAGAELNGWNVPSLRAGGSSGQGIGKWSVDDIVQYLQTGRNRHASVGGEMSSVVEHSTSYMTDADLRAIAAYLKTLPAGEQAAAAATPQQIDQTTQKLSSAQGIKAGERVYLDNCTACHFVTGLGAAPTFPPLAGNELANAEDPTGLITVILNGSQLPSTAKAPTQLTMPDFGWRLTNQQVADLATFVRSGWGNHGGAVSATQVQKIRENLPPPKVTAKPEDLDGVEYYSRPR